MNDSGLTLELTPEDQEHLDRLEKKFIHIRDAVRGVAKEFHTGLVLWGEGGTGKSYAVMEELKKLKTKHTVHNTRMTGRGLVDALEMASSDVHLIEDADTLFDDKKAWGVLRSALWSQSKKKPPERIITWTAYRTTIRFIFTGGIIIVGNTNVLTAHAELRALATRITVLHFDVNNNEMKALMKKICKEGHAYGEYYLSPEECWQVGKFIVNKLEEMKRSLDLRLLMNGFKDFLQHKTGNSRLSWEILLEGRMKERVHYQTRDEIKGEETRVAMAIYGNRKLTTKGKEELWTKQTGLSLRAFYRALKRSRK